MNVRIFYLIASSFLLLPGFRLQGPPSRPPVNVQSGLGNGSTISAWKFSWEYSGNVAIDRTVKYAGDETIRISRSATSAGSFSSVGTRVPANFEGTTISLHGKLRVLDVKGTACLWLRENDSRGRLVAFVNNEASQYHGTNDWREFSLSLPLNSRTATLHFGALLLGEGTAWVADVGLLVDGVPVPYASGLGPVKREHIEPHGGAGTQLSLSNLTTIQVENLATLGEVWGYLKYHDSRVTSGHLDWDSELLKQIPLIVTATNYEDRNQILLRWLESLGNLLNCKTGNYEPARAWIIKPDLSWIYDTHRFGATLSDLLSKIYQCRVPNQQYYVNLSEASSPFVHERLYETAKFPDMRYQLLALFRWWNIVEWWYPDRDILRDPHTILRHNLRDIALAQTRVQYIHSMMRLIAETRDSHSYLVSSLNERPPQGACRLPISLSFVSGQLVVWRLFGKGSNVKIGDVIERIDGAKVEQLRAKLSPYYSASNAASKERDIASQITKGACETVRLLIKRGTREMPVDISRREIAEPFDAEWHDHAGPAFRFLTPEIAYLRMGAIRKDDIDDYIKKAASAHSLIIDLRDYPAAFAVFDLGDHFVTTRRLFARFVVGDSSNPGAFHFLADQSTTTLSPLKPYYAGKIAILIDATTQSQAEFTALAFHEANGALLVGERSAGADGGIATVNLPYDLQATIAVRAVYTAERKRTQPNGLKPDIFVSPTIKGIAQGRDEVLEVAISAIAPTPIARQRVKDMAHR